MGKNEEDAKLLAPIGAGFFLGFATSIIYAIHLMLNEVSMNANTMKYESTRMGLWAWFICSILFAIKYCWITSKKLMEIDKKYKEFSVLKRTIIRWILILVFILIPVSLFLTYRYIEVNF